MAEKEPMGEWKTPDKYSGFACACGDNEKEMEALNQRVYANAMGGKGAAPWTRHWTTHLLHTLHGAYGAWVEDIALDMWGGLAIEGRKGALYPDEFHMYIQFDVFEDGLALALDGLFEKYGKERPEIVRSA